LTKILLVRHGLTTLHHEDRFWGSTDVPLNKRGAYQAECLRERLAGERLYTVYASTLGRARATAEIIAAPHSLDVTACPELGECNFGFVEGLTFDEIKKQRPDLARDLTEWKATAFPGGESLTDMNTRLQPFLKRLAGHRPKDTVLVVAHGGPIRLLICNLLGLPMENWLNLRIDLASLSIVETYPQGTILTLLNDVSHLKE
jgi:alpha-ribazole phosphatase